MSTVCCLKSFIYSLINSPSCRPVCSPRPTSRSFYTVVFLIFYTNFLRTFIRHQSDIKSKKDKERDMYTKETFIHFICSNKIHTIINPESKTNACSNSGEKKQFHDGNTLILAFCQMSLHYSQIHHYMSIHMYSSNRFLIE